jgi:hypothetical protein
MTQKQSLEQHLQGLYCAIQSVSACYGGMDTSAEYHLDRAIDAKIEETKPAEITPAKATAFVAYQCLINCQDEWKRVIVSPKRMHPGKVRFLSVFNQVLDQRGIDRKEADRHYKSLLEKTPTLHLQHK